MKPDPQSLLFDSRNVNTAPRVIRLVAVLVMLGMPLCVQAADRFWDGANSGGTGDGASDGGTAAWNTSTLNWDQGNALNRVNWTNANNDTAIFGGTAGTVSLGSGITVGGLQFDTPSYIIQGNTLTFGAAGAIAQPDLRRLARAAIAAPARESPVVGTAAAAHALRVTGCATSRQVL